MAIPNAAAVAKGVHPARAWFLISAAVISAIYLLIVGLALFDHFAREHLSNEGAAGLSLLALLPALPLSFLLNWLLEAVGLAKLFAPFETGLANVLWVAAVSWVLALAQWSWGASRVVAAVRARGH